MPQDPSGFTPDVEGFTPDPTPNQDFGSLSGVNFNTPAPELSWYDPDYLIPMGLRTVPAIAGGILGGTAGSIVPFAGTVAGTSIGGAGGSFLGENLAQGYEMLRGVREHYNPYSVGVNTALGAIPSLGKAPGLGATAEELTKYAIKAPVMGAVEGGVLGGVGSIPQEWAETGGLPSLSQVGKATAVGAGFGAVTGGAMGSYPSIRKARGMRETPLPIHDPTIPADLPLNVVMPPEFRPIDAPTVEPTPVVHPPAPTVVKAPVNPLRPEIPPGQLTNQDMANALTTRAAQEAPPVVPEAPAVPHEFAPVEQPALPPAPIEKAPEVKIPEVLPTMDEVSAKWGSSEGGINANDMEVLRQNALSNATDQEIVDAINQLNRDRLTRKQNGVPTTASQANEARRLEMEANHRGITDIVPEPFTDPNTPPSPQQLNPAEQALLGNDRALPPGEPEVEFVDPNTGEIIPASQAKPGDVLLPRGESSTGESNVPPVEPPGRRVHRRITNAERMRRAQGSGGGNPPPQNPPFDTSGYVPPEGTPPVRDPRLAGARQMELPGTAQPQPAANPANYPPYESQPFPPVRQQPLPGHQMVNPEAFRGYPEGVNAGPMPGTQPEIPGTAQPQPRFDTGAPPSQVPPMRQPEIPGTQQAQPRFDTGAAPQPIPQGMKQQPFPGIEPQRPKGWVTEDKLKPGVPVKRRKPQKSQEQTLLGKIWDTPRSLQSIDAPGITSAALRQSRPLIFTKEWFKAWGTAAKSFRNKNDVYKAMQDAIKENKYFKPQYEAQYNKNGQLTHYVEKPSIAERAGLLMSDVLNNREDAIRSSLAEQIPGYGRYVTASNRAYTAFLNHLRVTKFEQMMEAAIIQGRGNDDVLAKKIADYVNNATGRGRLKFGQGKYSLDLEPLADELGHALYSPRALAARLAFMNPTNYLTADPMIRKEYWKSLGRMVASWGAFAGLGALAGGEVVGDFSSSDAGKVKFGNTRYDPGAGWLQLMHLVGKEYYGGSTSTTSHEKGRPGTPKFTPFGDNPVSGDMWTPLQRYLKNQMNPMTGYVVDLLTAARGGKEPFDVTDRTLQLVVPMFVDDIARAAQEDSTVQDVFAGILGSAGIGGQTYDKGDFGKPNITPAIEDLTGFQIPTVTLGGKKK